MFCSETRCICYIPLQLLLPCLSMSASCLTISAQFRVTVYIDETVWLTLATQRSKNSPMMSPVYCSYTRRPFLPSLVCLFFSHGTSNTRASKITTKPDIEMFHDESWKLICFAVRRSKVKVTSHKHIAGVGLCTLVSAGFLRFDQFSVKFSRLISTND